MCNLIAGRSEWLHGADTPEKAQPFGRDAAAEEDFQGIVEWTISHFGEAQALVYAKTLALASARSAGRRSIARRCKTQRRNSEGAVQPPRCARGTKGTPLHHVSRSSAGRGDVIEVLRLLHDSMDLPRHFRSPDET